MYDDNWNDEIDNDFETDFDAYETEVNNKEWIAELISGIDLD